MNATLGCILFGFGAAPASEDTELELLRLL